MTKSAKETTTDCYEEYGALEDLGSHRGEELVGPPRGRTPVCNGDRD
jgi:hypothetical protein